MLTDKPNIVIAHAPKRNRTKRQAATVPARIVDHRKAEDVSEDEMRQRGEAADRLWQEIKRAVTGE